MNRNLWLLAATITFQFAMCYDITNVYFTGETANFLFFFPGTSAGVNQVPSILCSNGNRVWAGCI